MGDLDDLVRELLRQGRHREAGELLLEAGEPARAMEAYAAVWDWDRAASIALEAGDLARALDYRLRAGGRAEAAEVRRLLAAGPEPEAERAVQLLLDRGEKDEASRLLEARGEHARAAELLRETGELRRAAELLERAGQYRDAGRLYEQILSQTPDDGPAALALGGILARFGRHEPAARMFQVAARAEGLKKPALRALVVALDAMGLRDAAGAALEELLALDASAPRSVAALVATEASAERAEPAEGQWLAGRYRVLRLLGGGAAGRVYLTRDALYEREVALKVLAAAADGGGRDAYGRFLREAQIAAKLQHPNIVRLIDFDEASGIMAMEYLSGGTLADRIAKAPVPLAEAREVLLAVLAALEAAHLRGVIHRDVKPQNVLFGRAGEIKLADFGVAHLQDLGLTQTGAFIGTLTYMAPEQITGDRVSAATDLYGLGATLFHAIVGRPPFVGADLVRQHLAEEPPAPSSLRPALGDRLDALFARLLAKTPAERYGSAAEVRAAAEALDFSEPAEAASPERLAPEPIRAETESAAFDALGPAVEVRGGRARLARHRDLDLRVRILELDEARLAALATLGRAASPFLQAVLDVDVESRTALLASPEGELLSVRLASAEGLPAAEALRVADEVASALEALHESGAAHGAVAPSQVLLGPHRSLLLLPDEPAPADRAGADAEALLALVAACVGGSGRLPALVGTGRLREALGATRAKRLASEVPLGTDLPSVRKGLAAIRRALDDRAAAREHLHALAAAARAAGADPKGGPIAELLAKRRAELDA